ncbi:MAG: polyprenol monophosphomannose synthase [Chitinophagales bacterium]
MKRILIIIPTYNEKENIARMVESVFQQSDDFHLLIVDDNSPDGTAGLIKELMEQYPNRLFLESRQGKLGLGTAYIHGFKWGIKNNYDYILEMDADFSHPPEKLIELVAACENGADIAVGSRYTSGGKVKDWPMSRIMLSYFANLYVQFITWIPCRDATAGFVCYKKEVLETINLDSIKFIGYAFQIEMKYKAWKLGFGIAEVPITFVDRIRGTSKMSTHIFKEAMFGVLELKWKGLTGKL